MWVGCRFRVLLLLLLALLEQLKHLPLHQQIRLKQLLVSFLWLRDGRTFLRLHLDRAKLLVFLINFRFDRLVRVIKRIIKLNIHIGTDLRANRTCEGPTTIFNRLLDELLLRIGSISLEDFRLSCNGRVVGLKRNFLLLYFILINDVRMLVNLLFR